MHRIKVVLPCRKSCNAPFLGTSILLPMLLGVQLVGLPKSSAGQRGPGNQPRMVLQALDADRDGTLSPAEIKAAPQSLLTLDRNGDGQLTADELQPRPENAGATPDELVKQLMVFDKNGDGILTRDEVPARMQNLFERGDTNHDGKLTADEIRALANRQGMPAGPQAGGGDAMMRMDPILNALDTNHDGIISADEIAAASQSLLTLDKNADGQITPDEMRQRQQGPGDQMQHFLEEFDTNKDGKISRAEAPEGMQQQFDTLDKNHDGFLDKDELMQMFSNMRPGQQRQPENPGSGTPNRQN